MPKYMLLLHEDPSAFATFSPQQMQEVIEKYMRWGQRLREAGVMSESNKLADEPGKVVRGRPESVRVIDGPFSETKEILSGYYVITAGSYDEAVERARGCPHLEYGGTIEVRQVDQLS
jgi:hypothetical protein